MIISKVTLTALKQIEERVFILKCHSPELAKSFKPGQFANIRVSDHRFPLLRHPFSISDVEGDSIFFMIAVHGEGTSQLCEKRPGDQLDIIAPLGNGFNIDDECDLHIILAGGIGSAPFPFLTRQLAKDKIVTYVGGRTAKDVITYGLRYPRLSTDDGSSGYKGNVVQYFRSELEQYRNLKVKIYACGPSAMLRAVKQLLETEGLDGEISTESAMACGFGICQGCPIEKKVDDGRYLLICKDGPVFNTKEVIL